MKKFAQKLDGLKDKGRYRSLALPHGIDLTSNDYLGLAGHPKLRAAAITFLQNGGDIGAGGSRLLRGHGDVFAALETYAAEVFAAPKTLYFSSGFQANAALFQALPTRQDVIVFDEFVHASARDGIQNSHAQHIKAAHNDLDGFEDALKRAAAMRKSGGQVWVAVESVYSMDGDIAPLADLYDLAEAYDGILIVDEAHGTGVCGASGKGVSEELARAKGYERLIVLHTCGKAMGVAGGLVCASEAVIDTLINAARGFVYSTAPMPLQAHLVQHALGLIVSEEGAERRERLAVLSAQAQAHFGAYGAKGGTHIVPIIIGGDEQAVYAAKMLQQKGCDIRAIRPPSVPEGTARLRLSLSADLDGAVLEAFAADFEEVIREKAA